MTGPAVLGIVRAKRADIKEGDFVGIAAIPGKEGKLHAQEVLIFPEAARGEGHYPWDLAGEGDDQRHGFPHRQPSKNRVLTQEILLAHFKPGDLSLIKPGAMIFIPRASKKPGGTIIAARAIAEQNGVKTPM